MLILKINYYFKKSFEIIDNDAELKDKNRKFKAAFDKIEHSIVESKIIEQIESCENFLRNFNKTYPEQRNMYYQLEALLKYKRKELIKTTKNTNFY